MEYLNDVGFAKANLNSQFIDKRVSFYPKPQISPDQRPEIAEQLSNGEKSQLRNIHRGHLGIPEEIMKAGASQYATMCNNINNKVTIIQITVVSVYKDNLGYKTKGYIFRNFYKL
jgi:hypothetical protein